MPENVSEKNPEQCKQVSAFYTVCPRRTLMLLAITLERITLQLESQLKPPGEYITVLDVMPGWSASHGVHLDYKAVEKVVVEYTADKAGDTADYKAIEKLLPGYDEYKKLTSE